MKKILLTLAAFAVFSGAALAAQANPPLLCDEDVLKAPAKATPAVCEPPPPVCPPAPAPETPACPPQTDYKVVQVPVKTTVCEVKTVPVTRRVVEEESYVASEPRSVTYNEQRTRTARRTVEVPSTKMVSEAKIVKLKSPYGESTRLARGVSRKVVPTTRKEVEEYEETYMHPVKYTYNEQVVKTRKVTRKIEEYKTVTVPRTVTTMETRVVAK